MPNFTTFCLCGLFFFSCVPLYYSADCIEESSEKQVKNDWGFQSDILFYKPDWNSGYWIMAWIAWLEMKPYIPQIF